MKQQLATLLKETIAKLQQDDKLPKDLPLNIHIERTRDNKFGDYASNIAMMLSKPTKQAPRQLAQLIIDALPATELLEKTEIAGPGFINFFLTSASNAAVIKTILTFSVSFGEAKGRRLRLQTRTKPPAAT